MDDMENKDGLEKSIGSENSLPPRENRNILEEMKNLEKIMRDSGSQTFKKTTYWNQLNNTQNNIKNDSALEEILECLIRIESKITQIETMLNK